MNQLYFKMWARPYWFSCFWLFICTCLSMTEAITTGTHNSKAASKILNKKPKVAENLNSFTYFKMWARPYWFSCFWLFICTCLSMVCFPYITKCGETT